MKKERQVRRPRTYTPTKFYFLLTYFVAVAIYYPYKDTTWTKHLDLICKQKPETQT